MERNFRWLPEKIGPKIYLNIANEEDVTFMYEFLYKYLRNINNIAQNKKRTLSYSKRNF